MWGRVRICEKISTKRWKRGVADEGVPAWRGAMSTLSCNHDCLSDLLCGEDVRFLAADEAEGEEAVMYLPEDVEEVMAELVAEEGDYVPVKDYGERYRSGSLNAAARGEAIAWMRKVHGFYSFQPLTAYLCVNYWDRFLASHQLPQGSGWPLQLLNVASLALAAKMEETLVPSLLDLQVEEANYIFEPRTIRRMEFLVLNALNWRLRSITPFTFIDFFAYKVDPDGGVARFLLWRANPIILATTQEIGFLEYWPSTIAAAAMICAVDAFPSLSRVTPGKAEAWCIGLNKEKIESCYNLMRQLGLNRGHDPRTKPAKIFPEMGGGPLTPIEMGSVSLSPFPGRKRRKLNDYLWADDEHEHDIDGDHQITN